MSLIATKIRFLREQQSLSVRGLAEASGISAAALSQLEAGNTSPSVATLEKLADGLGMAVSAFFIEPGTAQDIEVFDLNDRPSVDLSHGGRFVPLTALHQPTGFEPMLVHLEANGCFDENQYGIKSPQAFVWIRRGKARFEFDGREFDLRETQSVYYDARKPHNWRNISAQPCELLMVRSR